MPREIQDVAVVGEPDRDRVMDRGQVRDRRREVGPQPNQLLGHGQVSFRGVLNRLRASGYDGWIVVEQDRIPRPDEELAESAGAQVRNRAWLREHVGV